MYQTSLNHNIAPKQYHNNRLNVRHHRSRPLRCRYSSETTPRGGENDDVNDAEEDAEKNEDEDEIVAKQQQRWCCMLLEYFYVYVYYAGPRARDFVNFRTL